MATYEEEVRRQMEIEAAKQASGHGECPVEEEVDATFGFREAKKAMKKRQGPLFNKKYAVKKVSGMPKSIGAVRRKK